MALMEQILEKRGITKGEAVHRFLNPDFDRHLSDPVLMHDAERAVVRIFEAIEAKEKIAIYSDYDCDGIPGNVIFADLFRKIGYTNFIQYIPDRHTEGYGLHIDAIDYLKSQGVSLIITVDLGITAVEGVTHATLSEIDVIVTDHHEPLEVLPKAFAIVNPKLGTYPDRMLCGAGVAFRLVQLFLHKYGEYYSIPKGWEKWLLDLVAIATLSDMVPLQAENRVLAYYGLMVLQKTKRLGICALFEQEGMRLRDLTEDDVVFTLSPRINAASRMDDPHLALMLLQTENLAEAKECVKKLTAINTLRKQLVMNIMKESKKTLATRELHDVLVIGNPNWRIGVLGLVANNLLEAHGRPVFVWGREESGAIKGSCRSRSDTNVVDLMQVCAHCFTAFGGHSGAGGFTVIESSLHSLESELSHAVGLISKTIIETEMELFEMDANDVSYQSWKELRKLAPFGMDNPKPLFEIKNIVVEEAQTFGKDKNHLKIFFYDREKGTRITGLEFFATPEKYGDAILRGNTVTLRGYLERSVFRGKEELRIRISAIYP